MKNNFIEILDSRAKAKGIFLDEEKLEKIDLFRRKLLLWNKTTNLTRIVEDVDFAEKHIIDSLMVAKNVELTENASLIDIGTGAGFPGIPLKIYRPDLHVTLLESIGKKTRFLESIISDLKLENIQVVNERAEDAAKRADLREKFDFAVARAVSKLNVLTEICLPFVKLGGYFIVMKSTNIDEEIKAARNALKIIGGKITGQIQYNINEELNMKLILIKKVKETPKKYPRRSGLPGSKPL